jgi:sulfate transport system ATP-binding protein
MPTQLSGGQRQRSRSPRAGGGAAGPLLDEPSGALDARVARAAPLAAPVHDDLGITSLFVTHDQEEALELADRVVVVNEGRIEQVGAPDEVYRRPATPFVFGFLGEANWLDSKIDGKAARVGFRPDDLELSLSPLDGHGFAARVKRVQSLGPRAKIELLAESGAVVQAEVPAERVRSLSLAPGLELFAAPRELQVFFEEGSRPRP